MCNIILDGAGDFLIEGENLETVLGLKPHILIYSDGGCRNQGRSAVGYIIYGVIFGYAGGGDDDNDLYVLAMGGKQVNGDHNSLFLEALALDTALKLSSDYLVAGRSLGSKRQRMN